MSTVLRPLSIGELLDRTFFLYRNNFVLFAGIAAIAHLPVLALRLGNSALIASRHAVGRTLWLIILLIAVFLAVAVAHAATVIAVSEVHLDRKASIGSAYSEVHLDRKASIGSAYAGARRSLLRVIWISFVATVAIPFFIGVPAAVVVGMVLSPLGAGLVGVVPVVSLVVLFAGFGAASYWWLARALVVPVTVLEGTGLGDSMDRSKFLTEDRRGRVFVVCLLVVALTYAITLLFQSPAYAVGGVHWVRGRMITSHASAILMAIGGFVGASLTGPLLTIALTLVYYDGRVRKEGFDLQVMMANLASVPEAAPVAGTN